MGRVVITVACVAVAAATAAWLLLQGGRAVPERGEPAPEEVAPKANATLAPAPAPVLPSPMTPAKARRNVAGILLMPGGTPAAGVEVALHPAGHEGEVQRTTTDRDGEFRFDGLPESGAFRIEATVVRQDGTRLHIEGEVAPGEAVRRWELAPVAVERGGTRRVRVLDDSGRPVDRATVVMFVPTAWGSSRSGFGGFLDLADGQFTVDDRSTHQPARWYESPGTSFEIFGAKRSSGELMGLTAAKIGPLVLEETVVRLEPERTIEGHVLGTDGAAFPGVLLSAFPASDATIAIPNAHGSTATDEKGAFRLGGLWDGEYRIAVALPGTPEGFAKNPDNVPVGPVVPGSEPPPSGSLVPSGPRVVRSGTKDVTYRFLEASSALARVVDANGRAVEGALVVVSVPGSTGAAPTGAAMGRTDAAGTATVAGVDPDGTYALVVQPPQDRYDLRPHADREWAPRETTVRLPRGVSVSGVVKDANGRPAPGALVAYEAADGRKATVMAKEDGSFRTPGLAEGDVTLRARARASMTPGAPPPRGEGPAVTVAAGSVGVALTLP